MNVCPHCHLGRLQRTAVSYVCWLDGHMMLVPRTPAYVCDVCNNLEYDPDFMVGVRYMIYQHEAGHNHPTRVLTKKPAGKAGKTTGAPLP